MHYFSYRDGELFAEEVALGELARRFGTPLYVYSARTLRRHFRVMTQAFEGADHLVCYAVKALSNLSVLRLFASLGAGFDIVSGGELQRCLRAGAVAEKIVFSGVGKTTEEIAAALKAGILMFNVESRPELELIAAVARQTGRRAPVSIRVNPALDPGTHPHISTGQRDSKFGVPLAQVEECCELARRLDNLVVKGLSIHIGSQITELGPFAEAAARLKELALRLGDRGFSDLQYLDLGGGIGIPYRGEALDPVHYARTVLAELGRLRLTLIFEPGRMLVGNAGVLVTTVIYLKETDVKRFVVVDAAMNDLVRPALYEAYHEIQPVSRRQGPSAEVDVVGPVCESGDFLARGREMVLPQPGDLLAVMGAGAYGFVMASNYNTRPRAAEVLVDGAQAHLVRARETFADLIRSETIVELPTQPA